MDANITKQEAAELLKKYNKDHFHLCGGLFQRGH